MRNVWTLTGAGSLLFTACLVDGTAQPGDSQNPPGTGYSGSSTGQAGTATVGMAGTATVGTAGTATVGTAGSNAAAGATTGGASSGGTSTGTGGTNVPVEGGSGSTETNPGKGNGFFPTTILPSHAKTAYTTWKTKYLKTCSGNRFRVAFNADETVSEGIGYGMILTVAHGDRAEFDGLWAYYKSRATGGLMGWKASGCDNTTDPNSASDADLDAAMGLIQAACKWGGTYLTEATTLIANIKAKETIEGGTNYLKPASSGLDSCQNASYFSPGYYRAFAKKKPDQAAFWNKLATDTYTTLNATANATTGLVPNWSTLSGSAGCGGNVDSDKYGYDAARTPWRIAVDYVWNGTPAAKTYLAKLVTWVDGPAGGITAIGDKYTLSGTKESVNHNSTFTGAFALAAMSVSQEKANLYGSAFRAISDSVYYEESLRAMYMLLASGLFLNACE
jgi:endoglucanase